LLYVTSSMDKIKDYEKMILEYKLQRNHYEI